MPFIGHQELKVNLVYELLCKRNSAVYYEGGNGVEEWCDAVVQLDRSLYL